MHDVVANDRYFQQKCDASNIFGFSSIHKCIVALKMLAYGVTTNACGVYCRLGKSIVMEALKRFCKVVMEYFETKYLWQLARLTLTNNYKSMLIMDTKGCSQACIICMMCGKFTHCLGKYQFNHKNKNNNIILEIIANQSLRFWYVHFGLQWCNMIWTIFYHSPFVVDFLSDVKYNVKFVVNGNEYAWNYLLVDGIYLHWSIVV